MICAKTFMKEMPERCHDCTFFTFRKNESGMWDEVCVISNKSVFYPVESEWHCDFKTRPKACPLYEAFDVPQGTWVEDELYEFDYGHKRYDCSECGKKAEYKSQYCPHCGAKMKIS